MIDPPWPSHGRGAATRSGVRASRGMVCAAQPLAAAAGLDVLRRGGSAVDAAVATNACLAVMEPTACGLGGDLFALLWVPTTRSLLGLNASGRAPAAHTIERVRPGPDGTIPLRSPSAWTVPGCVDGWYALHGRFGRLRMAELLAPAIEYALDGFPLSPVIAQDWLRASEACSGLPGFHEVFMPG